LTVPNGIEVGGRVRGIAADELRRHNLSAVLDRIHLSASVSRSDLAVETGLNRSTIKDLLAELAALGLVVEDSQTASGAPGRPSAVGRARPAGAVVLAAELEVDFTAVATIGLGGHVFDTVRAPNSPGAGSPAEIVAAVARLAEPLLAALPAGRHVIGVGAAAAGLVRRSDGFLTVSPNRDWHDVPLGSMLAEAVGVRHVRVANEADVGALAEHRRGAARDARHVLYVSGEVGLGLGVIYDDRPMFGAAGYAGEAGHAVINPSGRACRCGSTGCWETEVGEEALARRAGVGWDEGNRREAIDEVLRRAHRGDPQVFDAFREVGHWLGLGVANLVNTFNPELVVFGGFYHPLFPFLEQPLVETARRATLPGSWETCRICRSSLGNDARLIGAAELVFADLIANPSRVASLAGDP
jgi:predicted NBD/HSP70 family sugar kinase